MRLRPISGSADIIKQHDKAITEPATHRGGWHRLFGNQQPIHVEIGMGKGGFLMAMAKAHPTVNYLGFEKYEAVFVRALRKYDRLAESCPNLYFVQADAEQLLDLFEEEEVAKIYLNFSDPWPKERHAKRRLTERKFLERYAKVLQNTGELQFRTDNQALFEFSLTELEQSAFRLLEVTNDLHGSSQSNSRQSESVTGHLMTDVSVTDNSAILTEYETKFIKQGIPIKQCRCRLK